MKFEWLDTELAGGWHLHLMNGTSFVASLGILHAVEDGYVIFHTPNRGSDPVSPCYLPADLTLDEAKSAAELILATGRTS